MSTSSQNDPAKEPEQDLRGSFIAGLRTAADWLEANPDAPVPFLSAYDAYKFTVLLNTNTQVEQVAAALGLEVAIDPDGNMSCGMTLGKIRWHMYGYADFKDFSDRLDGQSAHKWAKSKGLEIVKPLVSDDTIRQADNLLRQNIADREAAENDGGAL